MASEPSYQEDFSSSMFLWLNDTHTCVNASYELHEFHANRKGYIFHIFRTMCILPLVNVVLNIFAVTSFSRIRPCTLLIRLLLALSSTEIGFQLWMGVNQILQSAIEGDQLVAYSEVSTKALAWLFTVSIVLATTGHIVRNWMVVLIAIMRYETVCRQSTQRILFQNSRIRIKITIILTAAILISLPRIFELRFFLCSTKNQVVYIEAFLLKTDSYMYGYLSILILFQSICPVVLVCVLSCILLRVIYQRRNIKCSVNPQSSHSYRCCDRIIILLCVTFCLCESPSCLKIISRMTHTLHEIGWLMNLMPSIDSTLNIFIYFYTNTIFRRERGFLKQFLPISTALTARHIIERHRSSSVSTRINLIRMKKFSTCRNTEETIELSNI